MNLTQQLIFAYAYYFGGYALTHLWENYNGFYTGGAIFTVINSTVMALGMLGSAVTQFKFVFEAQVAGKMAYNVIDHKAEV